MQCIHCKLYIANNEMLISRSVKEFSKTKVFFSFVFHIHAYILFITLLYCNVSDFSRCNSDLTLEQKGEPNTTLVMIGIISINILYRVGPSHLLFSNNNFVCRTNVFLHIYVKNCIAFNIRKKEY